MIIRILKKMGLYDPKTDTLDEEGLKAAGRKMMETLFEKEQLNETGYWMATIHRNTKHIHIHFAVVEKKIRVNRIRRLKMV